MFDASLRRRSLWKTLGPLLASSTDLRLRESEFRTHDLSVPLASGRGNGERHLHVILLTPSFLDDDSRLDTISKLDRFSTLTGGRDIAIALLQSDEGSPQSIPTEGGRSSLHGLLDLQSIILQHISVPIPIIPVPHTAGLLLALQEYIKDLEKAPDMCRALLPTAKIPTFLLSHATTKAPHRPLSEHDTNILSDLFPSFRSLSQALMTREGRDVVREYFDEETAKGIIEFCRS